MQWRTTNQSFDKRIMCMCYAQNKFVGISNDDLGDGSCIVIISTDGENWSSYPIPSKDWVDIAYGNGVFVAVADDYQYTNAVMTSPDGINWTLLATTVPIRYFSSIEFLNGKFVALSSVFQNDPIRIMTSPDGFNWTQASVPTIDYNYSCSCFGKGLFVVGANGDHSANAMTDAIITSPDGINWTSRTFPVPVKINSITYVDRLGLFFAFSCIDSVQKAIYTSSNGIDWTGLSITFANMWFAGVAFNNDYIIAITTSGDYPVIYSSDGINWNNVSWDEIWSYNYDICYGNGLFVATPYVSTYGSSPLNLYGSTSSIYTTENIRLYKHNDNSKPIRVRKAVYNGTSWELKPVRIKKCIGS
jgi:hypothetical protein